MWSVVALHRPAEFNKSHVPAFMAGEEPGDYVCVYPFVRSLDWYLLPDDERRKMLVEHGMAAREYKDVRANTVPAFALGDYEWILAFEAPGPGPHRRPDVEAARHRRAPPRPRGDAVLHRPAGRRGRARRQTALTAFAVCCCIECTLLHQSLTLSNAATLFSETGS